MAKNHASRTVAVKLSPLASILPALLLTLMFVSAWAHAAEIDYVYDDLGRLRAVIDPSSDTAVYNYDAVGNLLSIFRQSSSVVSIIDFSPKAGPVGTNVTIYGTGFSATPSQNSVTFNGLAATVTTATTTKIVTSVPSGATTGLIGVTAPGGSASSTQVFTVTESTGAPTITGFSPTIGTPGTAVNITGTNFESTPSRNNLFFNVTNAQIASSSPAAISATAPAGTSGRLTVATRFGTAVSTGDFFIPPSPYTPASVELTGRMVLGESRTISISTANKIGLILFDGVQGQRVSVNFSNVTISSTTVRIYNPDGTISATGTVPTVGETIDSAALPVTGTYTILIDPDSTYTGNMTLSLHDVLTTAVPITPNGPGVNVNIATPGQEAVFSFSGTAGQKMSALLSDLTVNGCPSPANFAMYAPNGSKLGGGSPCWATSYFIEPQILPVTGTYTLVVDGIGSATFQGTVNLYQVVDITGNITPNAPSTNVNLATPGQRAIFSFSGTAGQKMSALLSNLTVNGCASPADFSIYAPNGTKLVGGRPCWATSYFIEPQILPVTGTYTLVVDGIGSATFQGTVNLYQVVDITGNITPNAPSTNVNLATPGQRAIFSFSGTAGQKMSALLSNLTVNGCASPVDFSMYAPSGTKLAGGSPCWATSYFIEPQTLSATGTYTLVVDGIGSATFQGTVSLYEVVDITGNITPNAPSTNVNIATPGQRAVFSFSGTAGQKMSALLSNLTVNGCASPVDFSMHAPSGTKLAGGSPCWATSYLIQPQTLPVTGTYSLVVDGIGSATFQATVKVYEVLNLTLAYNGKIRDRVGQGDTALSPDGSLDGTFTASLPAGSGNRTVTLLDLKNNNGGEWDTVPNGFWVLGAANGFDTALFNSSNAAVNFSVADGGSFVLFGSDYANSHFNSGRVFTLTVNFADGAVGTGNVTVP